MSKLKLFAALALVAIGIVAAPLSASGPPRVPVVADWAVTDNLTAARLRAAAESGRRRLQLRPRLLGRLCVPGHVRRLPDRRHHVPVAAEGSALPAVQREPGRHRRLGHEQDKPDLLVRSYNTPAPAGLTCDGQTIPTGFEGIHVFDLSNFGNPQLVAQVPVTGGSHTATLVPDTANNRVIIYNQTSGSTPPFISIISVPLNNLAGTSVIGTAPLTEAGACHDSGVILGNVNKLVCASHDHANVYDIGANATPGGSLDEPAVPVHDLGAGCLQRARQPRRRATGTGTPPRSRSTARSSSSAGSPAAARSPSARRPTRPSRRAGSSTTPTPAPSSASSSCRGRRRQPRTARSTTTTSSRSGTRPASRATSSWAATTRPASASSTSRTRLPRRRSPTPTRRRSSRRTTLGGDWSTYWYNGRIYESDITRGLIIWRLDDPAVIQYLRTPHLNPQTAEFSID